MQPSSLFLLFTILAVAGRVCGFYVVKEPCEFPQNPDPFDEFNKPLVRLCEDACGGVGLVQKCKMYYVESERNTTRRTCVCKESVTKIGYNGIDCQNFRHNSTSLSGLQNCFNCYQTPDWITRQHRNGLKGVNYMFLESFGDVCTSHPNTTVNPPTWKQPD